ncbi:MAG: SET domain-containing protein [Puia sp.]|nr:SET domain-containing protein [Puia sp.]
MILPCLIIAPSGNRGRGVYTTEDLAKGTLIEVAPVIVMGKDDRRLLDQTLLHDYIFEWGGDRQQCCMALGYVPVYNHSYQSNCEYEMDYEQALISIKTVRFVAAGDELFINYNGDWNNKTPVWFDATDVL